MKQSTIAIDTGLLAIPDPDCAGVRCFKGIPYAAPPIGPLRWRPPEPARTWTGIRASDAFGMNAPQRIVFGDINPSQPGTAEDCLFLNIWTPAQLGSSERLPVMFWIHGGGFAAGHGAEPRYDGSKLAARSIVVITLNYRLGVLGFLAHPGLTNESPHDASGNWGLLDLVEALQWTRRNIATFGGDPDAVTIAGESAGAAAVSSLMASPMAKGLFARAIGQSGALFSAPARKLEARDEAERRGLDFARSVGAASADDLRRLSVESILAAAPGIGFRPIVDGRFLPSSPAEMFAHRKHNDVPLLAGWNKDEGSNLGLVPSFPGQSYEGMVGEMFGSRATEVLKMYPADDTSSARSLGGDARIIHATWAWIEAQKAYGTADIFRFRFERAPLTPDGWFGDKPSRDAGAFHSGEIPYVFDTLGAMPWLVDQADRDIARLTTSWWVNFVRTGNPNGPDVPEWPSHRSYRAPVMHIDQFATSQPAADENHRFLSQFA